MIEKNVGIHKNRLYHQLLMVYSHKRIAYITDGVFIYLYTI